MELYEEQKAKKNGNSSEPTEQLCLDLKKPREKEVSRISLVTEPDK